MSLGPFDLTGGPFLSLYAALLAVALVAGFAIPLWLRPEGRRRRVTDVDELAFLAGGAARFIEAVVARLLAARALIMSGPNLFAVPASATAETPAERRVLTLHAPIRWREVQRALQTHGEQLEQKLIGTGLLMTDAERSRLRFWSTLPYAVLIAFGATKMIVGSLRDRPIGYLTALVVLTVIAGAIRWFTIDRRTRAGRDAVHEARERSLRLRQAPTSPEVGIAVALFGTAVLAGSAFGDFHRLRSNAGSGRDGGGGSCGGGGGGSGGGGGCGGGGCGGCGS